MGQDSAVLNFVQDDPISEQVMGKNIWQEAGNVDRQRAALQENLEDNSSL